MQHAQDETVLSLYFVTLHMIYFDRNCLYQRFLKLSLLTIKDDNSSSNGIADLAIAREECCQGKNLTHFDTFE